MKGAGVASASAVGGYVRLAFYFKKRRPLKNKQEADIRNDNTMGNTKDVENACNDGTSVLFHNIASIRVPAEMLFLKHVACGIELVARATSAPISVQRPVALGSHQGSPRSINALQHQ